MGIELLPAKASTHALLDHLTRCRCGRETYWLVNREGETSCMMCQIEEELKGMDPRFYE